MHLYLFNPSHDEALAANLAFYTPTKAAKTLAQAWGELPAILAENGDGVLLTDDATYNTDEIYNADTLYNIGAKPADGVRRLLPRQLTPKLWSEVEEIRPWGWDAHIVHYLRRLGAPQRLLPSSETLDNIRRLSSRQTTVHLLPRLRRRLNVATVGEAAMCRTLEEAQRQRLEWGGAVMVKAPWSCSGRGVFAWRGEEKMQSRVERLMRLQGAVEIEPLYHRLADFALEFYAHPDGRVRYVAPSVFQTHDSGAYAANMVAPAAQLAAIIGQHVGLHAAESAVFVEHVASALEAELSAYLAARYVGPLGVDLLWTADARLLPCVEVNLRTTMGYVAARMAQRKLKAQHLPKELKSLWYFC